MKETITRGIIWDSAMRSALILGGISVAYELLALLSGLTGGFLGAILGGMLFLLLIFKVIVIILLFRRMMYELAEQYEGVTRREARRFGFETILLSSLIVAAFQLISVLYLAPEQITVYSELVQQWKEMQNNMFTMLPEQDHTFDSILDWSVRNYTILSFISKYINCVIWGVVLTFIFSSRIPRQNPTESR